MSDGNGMFDDDASSCSTCSSLEYGDVQECRGRRPQRCDVLRGMFGDEYPDPELEDVVCKTLFAHDDDWLALASVMLVKNEDDRVASFRETFGSSITSEEKIRSVVRGTLAMAPAAWLDKSKEALELELDRLCSCGLDFDAAKLQKASVLVCGRCVLKMLQGVTPAPMIHVPDVLHLAGVCSHFRSWSGWTRVRAIAARTCGGAVPTSLGRLLAGPSLWVLCAHAAQHTHVVSRLIAESPRAFERLAPSTRWEHSRREIDLRRVTVLLRQFGIDTQAPVRLQGAPGIDTQALVRLQGATGARSAQPCLACFALFGLPCFGCFLPRPPALADMWAHRL
mmetsp:Transcript_84573/g.262660  ORF Transcript_84573/g.262660 Transcript_84573/m.262660 type:complete len:337 (+) Transcript_84573:26-1036(+)